MANEQKGLKDRELQTYYEELASMFTSKGWTFFVEDLKKLYDVANAIDGISSMEALNFRLGQRDILAKIAAQPAVVAAAYEDLLEGDNL